MRPTVALVVARGVRAMGYRTAAAATKPAAASATSAPATPAKKPAASSYWRKAASAASTASVSNATKKTPVAASSPTAEPIEADDMPQVDTSTVDQAPTFQYPEGAQSNVFQHMNQREIDWEQSFQGLGSQAFSKEAAQVLQAPLTVEDIEITPDGLLYLPEIKYRRVLNAAFGPGGWGLAPRSDTVVTDKIVTREYGLICEGRLVSVARGEQTYFNEDGVPTASEGCKSNAMMRCCKDLGVASELWEPKFIRKFKAQHCEEVWGTHVVNKRKKKLWKLKGETLAYPYQE
ncbi:mitochondrial genome maintenance protein MGM101 [Yarrowia lipolytica]|nr:Mitochondrial genome maintenance protein [Yarrowia lipolytica]RDW35306.1 mitochondrial genome maintenance protein MGM101 [Yarrowia lipolytica]RDW36069.1 mitochondrial genome maintenance protein MGM101 [Yarrowia lipolytica]SEI34608.1 YALIA101S05e06304g1_1 [Yarrowia lipolytica]VBB79062.1 Protein with a role in mitochondrial DNA recombinational repair, putative [Yarrowia lipolytica]